MLCIEHDRLERKSVHVEVPREELVQKLKDELCSVVYNNQEEACLEVEGTREEIDDEFASDIRD